MPTGGTAAQGCGPSDVAGEVGGEGLAAGETAPGDIGLLGRQGAEEPLEAAHVDGPGGVLAGGVIDDGNVPPVQVDGGDVALGVLIVPAAVGGSGS